MSLITLGTIFAGGGLVEAGLSNKVSSLWAVENNREVAQLHKLNFPNCRLIEDDAEKINYSNLPVPTWIHASPPCQRFSKANTKEKEDRQDIILAIAVIKAITALKPRFFTLENVRQYENSDSHLLIKQALYELGYWLEESVINFANFGVPQNRYRLFTIAYSVERRISLPPKRQHQGWLKAIADLIKDFFLTNLTNTQIKLLKQTKRWIDLAFNGRTYVYFKGSILVKRIQLRDNIPTPREFEPSFTITASMTSSKNNSRNNFVNLISFQGTLALNTRALARLQTVPDFYRLSGNNRVDGMVIGNGVPSLFINNFVNNNW